MNVVPGWFWLALALATLVMMPSMVGRWRLMRGGRSAKSGLFDTLYTIISHIWLPAAVLAVPAVYVFRLLFF